MVSGAIALLLSSQVRKTSFAYFPHPLLRKRSKATFYNLAPNKIFYLRENISCFPSEKSCKVSCQEYIARGCQPYVFSLIKRLGNG